MRCFGGRNILLSDSLFGVAVTNDSDIKLISKSASRQIAGWLALGLQLLKPS